MTSQKAAILHLKHFCRFPQYIYVLHMILSTKCYYLPKQQPQIGLYNRDCVLYVFWTVHPRIISQIIQLGAQFCLNIFIYVSSLHVSGIQVTIIRRESLYLCDSGICHSGWVASGLPTNRHPYRVTNTTVA